MKRDILSTSEKALAINLDQGKYGTFAEIGAGQEVARWFFHVGGAAGTIAKTISAYDMTVSDAIYGPTQRYVSRQRLQSMLDHEFNLLRERLDKPRGETSQFFVFANTVTARSYSRSEEGHGWLGMRFQSEPRAEPSDIILHVGLRDTLNVHQQEILGILGVNLIHGAYHLHHDPVAFIESLLDNLSTERMEVDMIKFAGPAFATVDNRLMSLQLVRLGLTEAALFTANGEVVQASEILYKKPILVERGSFRPVTRTTLNMLQRAKAQFAQDPEVQGKDLVVLMEMTLRNLSSDAGEIHHRDFLDRVDLLGALGQTVLISNYRRFYRLAEYLYRYTQLPIGLALGMPTLLEVFDEKYYTDLGAGLLEAIGRLFKKSLRIYVYPGRDPQTGGLITAAQLNVPQHQRHLYAHLMENRLLQDLEGCDQSCLGISSREALAFLEAGDPQWESMVPPEVVPLIKSRGLFGSRPAAKS